MHSAPCLIYNNCWFDEIHNYTFGSSPLIMQVNIWLTKDGYSRIVEIKRGNSRPAKRENEMLLEILTQRRD
ncbi:MAG: hypothetical protein Ct9H300mP4_13450 [Gammaproteobacteria bacterium]|nr:MAG: hypothetical protein Ct9H300mP4_13450 [Gammaproteobacteria bacterium]